MKTASWTHPTPKRDKLEIAAFKALLSPQIPERHLILAVGCARRDRWVAESECPICRLEIYITHQCKHDERFYQGSTFCARCCSPGHCQEGLTQGRKTLLLSDVSRWLHEYHVIQRIDRPLAERRYSSSRKHRKDEDDDD